MVPVVFSFQTLSLHHLSLLPQVLAHLHRLSPLSRTAYRSLQACSSSSEKIVLASQAACGDDDALRDLGAAATSVTEAL